MKNSMKYNFDEIITRNGTNCVKYDAINEIFGCSDILPMWVADMDFRAPDCVHEVLRKRIEHPVYGYTFLSPRWKPAIKNWLERRNSWRVSDEEIGFVGGIVPALAFAIECFTKPGDGVLIQPPVYHPYTHVTADHGRRVVTNPLRLVNGQYNIDFDDFESKAKECRMFLLCHPHNPGGRVWNRDELLHMADICKRNNVLVVSDEIHCDMMLKGYTHTPFATISDDAAQNSITLMAASKTFNIAGLKSSYYIIGNPEIRKQYSEFLRINELDFAPLFSTEPVAAAYEEGEEWLDQMLRYVEENIDYVQHFIQTNMPRLSMIRPQASYLIFIDARDLRLEHDRLVDFFVKQAKVGLNDGAMFGEGGEGFMRMNVGCPRATVEEAMRRIKNAYDTL